MNRLACMGVSVAVAWVGALSASAQIEVVASTEYDQLLQYEPLLVKLKISNNTGTPLMVGQGGNAKLDFLVERRPGYSVDQFDGQMLAKPVLVKAGETQTVTADVSRVHNIRKTGSVTVIPRIRYDGHRFAGRRLLLEVVPGLEVANYRYMVPGESSSSRVCSLRTLYRNRSQRVFLRMENPTLGVCFGVFDLGRLVSQSKADMQSDSAGLLHVLHQSAPFRYTHSVFRPDGQSVKQEYLSRGNGQPQLARDDQGGIIVTGVETYEGDPSIDRPVIQPFDPFP